jgi:mannose/fructose/N-acetylgalactosamine-specific phosphotransferase system component IIC
MQQDAEIQYYNFHFTKIKVTHLLTASPAILTVALPAVIMVGCRDADKKQFTLL